MSSIAANCCASVARISALASVSDTPTRRFSKSARRTATGEQAPTAMAAPLIRLPWVRTVAATIAMEMTRCRLAPKFQKRRNRTWCGYWNDNCAHQLICVQDGLAIAGNEFAQRNVAGRTEALYAHACIRASRAGTPSAASDALQTLPTSVPRFCTCARPLRPRPYERRRTSLPVC